MAQNAVQLLEDDHQKIRKLLSQLTESTTRAKKKRQELLTKIEQELKVHTSLEEELFYPAFKAAGNAEHKKVYFEAIEEHRAVDDLVLPDLQKTDPASEQFSGRAKVLKEMVEHHADEEEQGMFKQARKSMSRAELQELGESMAARREELISQLSVN